MRNVRFVFPFLVMCLLSVQLARAQRDGPSPDDFRSPFRYVIIGDVAEIDRYVNRFPTHVSLQILIRDQDFTEKNLKALANLLLARYPGKTLVSGYVYSSLDAIKTPEEKDRALLWEPKIDSWKYKHAYFFLSDVTQWFEYKFPRMKKAKRIVIK